MINGIKPEFKVREALYSSIQHRDSDAFWAEKVGAKIDKLTDRITWMLGSYSKMHPLTSLEGYYGVNGISGEKILSHEGDGQYEYPVMGNLWVSNEVAETPASLLPLNLGYGNSLFRVKFKIGQFQRGQIVMTPNQILARVESDPRKIGNNFEYDFQLVSPRSTASMPSSEVQAGTQWMQLFNATSNERSYGSGSNVMYPGKVKNQVGYIQKTATWGNHSNLDKVMDFTFNVDGQDVKSWMSWYFWNFEKDWMSECEHAYWYSRYNRDANSNTVPMKDYKTGESIPMGSGLIEQIQNVSTYTDLTIDSLLDKMTAAYNGQYDTNNMEITLYTGKGGYRAFNDMMTKAYGKRADDLNILTDSAKFLSGEGYELAMTGYFNAVHLIDGYKVKVKINPLFDLGKVAAISPKHPTSKLPLESYRMVFVDDTEHDGMPNIQYVYKGEKAPIHAWGGGLTDAPKELMINAFGSVKDAKAPFRNSETGEAFYTRKKTVGINLRRANRCFMLEQAAA